MSRRGAFVIIGFLLLVLNAVVYSAVFITSTKQLTVSFLNVGQGDAIYIESPTGAEVLIDGGRDRSVLRELSKRMGPLDRSIDIVIETHPDADHIGGLPGVFALYDVDAFISPGVENDTNITGEVEDAALREPGGQTLIARRGQRIDIGAGAYLDILFPDREVPGLETNTASIIARLVYGDSSFMLTGDAPASIEEWLVTLDGAALESDVLKAGHHGSRTSTSEAWLAAVRPGLVVISAGEGNSYGHPHQEVVERIEATGATLATTFDGAVTLVSDGVGVRRSTSILQHLRLDNIGL